MQNCYGAEKKLDVSLFCLASGIFISVVAEQQCGINMLKRQNWTICIYEHVGSHCQRAVQECIHDFIYSVSIMLKQTKF